MIDREPRSGETLPDGFLLSVVYLSTRDECSNDRSERETSLSRLSAALVDGRSLVPICDQSNETNSQEPLGVQENVQCWCLLGLH